MHKLDNGITMHNPDKCIGCKYCEFNCPYGVIYFNWRDPHQFWRQREQLIKGVTSAPVEEAKKVNTKVLPYYNSELDATLPEHPDPHPVVSQIRRTGIASVGKRKCARHYDRAPMRSQCRNLSTARHVEQCARHIR